MQKKTALRAGYVRLRTLGLSRRAGSEIDTCVVQGCRLPQESFLSNKLIRIRFRGEPPKDRNQPCWWCPREDLNLCFQP